MSDAWFFFQDATPQNVVCKLCLSEKKTIAQTTDNRFNNTTRLLDHLKKRHASNDEYIKFQNKKNNAKKLEQTQLKIIDNNLSSINHRVHPTDENINFLIAEFIILDCQAYNVVENEGFKALMKLAFPRYKLPGREFFKELISKINEK